MTMLTVQAYRRWPRSIFVLLLLAAGFLFFSIENRKEPAVAYWSLGLFAGAALVRWLAEPRPLELLLENSQFTLGPANERFAYENIVAVYPDRAVPIERAPAQYALTIQLDDREIAVPARLNIPSADLESFLTTRMPQNRPLPDGALRGYLERALAEFGNERVWWARGVSFPRSMRVNRGLLISAGYLLIASIAGLIFGDAMNQEGVKGVSVFGLLFSLFLCACSTLPATRQGLKPKVKQPHLATVVVTPLGLALVQGPVQGEARWDEIKKVRLLTKPPTFALTRGGVTRGIDVTLAGATVRILDIYDRPIEEMHERIVAFWQ